MNATPPQDVDELRSRLKALGYLDAGVDRFVLAPARSGHTRLTLALAASLRIGSLAGLLAGLSGTIATALRLPTVVSGVRDALAVGAVLAVAFGVAAFLLALVVIVAASYAAGRLGRRVSLLTRMRPLALTAGFLVGSVCLGYLTLWWTVTNAAPGLSSATFVALVVAGVISAMLGRVTTTTALALMAFELDDHLPQAPRVSSPRALAGIVLLAVVAASLVAFIASRRGDDAPPPPTLTVVATGLRVLVLGVEGFDPAFAATLVQEGRLPALAHLLAAPQVGVARGADDDPVPVWATVATGQPPAVHGALGLESRRIAGLDARVPLTSSRAAQAVSAATDLLRLTRPAPSSGAERRAPALWEVAARAGLRTAVVDWWTSFPARSQDGIVVSDRAIVRLMRGGASEGEIEPADVFMRLTTKWPGIRTEASERAGALTRGLADARVSEQARHAIELDQTLAGFVDALPPDDLDLLALHLPGLDIVQVALLADRERMSPAELATAVAGISAGYASLDAIAGRLLDRGFAVVFVGHPGRATSARDAWLGVVWPQQPRDAGDFAATTPATAQPRAHEGPAQRPAPAASLEDVAPTVLALLGVPIAGDIAGRPRQELIPAAFATAHPVRIVSTWGTRTIAASARGAAPLDQETLERLRSLGYVR